MRSNLPTSLSRIRPQAADLAGIYSQWPLACTPAHVTLSSLYWLARRALSLQVALKGGMWCSVSMVLLARALSEEPGALPVDVEGYGEASMAQRPHLSKKKLRDRAVPSSECLVCEDGKWTRVASQV